MIEIKKNQWWKRFERLFDEEMLKRYDWFLFEFGKRITRIVHEDLLGRISQIPGSTRYKKSLIVAEIRDKGNRAWWTIIAKSLPLESDEFAASRSVIRVVGRYDGEENPVGEILERFSPWTIETIPFAPSARQAVVIIEEVGDAKVRQVANQKKQQMGDIIAAMKRFDLLFEPRFSVQKKLKVVTELEVEALRQEFGMVPGGKAHWRPAIKHGLKQGVRTLMKEKDLIKSITDPSFKKYKRKTHLRTFATKQDIKRIQLFQNKIRKAVKG